MENSPRTLQTQEATAAFGPAQGFPLGGSGRLCGVELVKVDSQEDMAVFALERAPPTDWPGRKGRNKRKSALTFVKRQ